MDPIRRRPQLLEGPERLVSDHIGVLCHLARVRDTPGDPDQRMVRVDVVARRQDEVAVPDEQLRRHAVRENGTGIRGREARGTDLLADLHVRREEHLRVQAGLLSYRLPRRTHVIGREHPVEAVGHDQPEGGFDERDNRQPFGRPHRLIERRELGGDRLGRGLPLLIGGLGACPLAALEELRAPRHVTFSIASSTLWTSAFSFQGGWHRGLKSRFSKSKATDFPRANPRTRATQVLKVCL